MILTFLMFFMFLIFNDLMYIVYLHNINQFVNDIYIELYYKPANLRDHPFSRIRLYR